MPEYQVYLEGRFETIMLTGTELLVKVKELGDVSKSDLVRSCGYMSTKKDGTERLNFTAFYEALLGAKGVSLGDGPSKGRGKGYAFRGRDAPAQDCTPDGPSLSDQVAVLCLA